MLENDVWYGPLSSASPQSDAPRPELNTAIRFEKVSRDSTTKVALPKTLAATSYPVL